MRRRAPDGSRPKNRRGATPQTVGSASACSPRPARQGRPGWSSPTTRQRPAPSHDGIAGIRAALRSRPTSSGSLANTNPRFRIEGHVHNRVDERLGHTRVLANPGGYTVYENRAYDPTLCVDV